MKDGLKTMRNPCGDETSMKEDGEKRSKKTLHHCFFCEYPEMVRLGMIYVQIEDHRRLMLKLCSR